METMNKKLNEEAIPGLRDFIACSALSCLATQKTVDWYTPEEVAKYCYKVADAMLKERERAKGHGET